MIEQPPGPIDYATPATRAQRTGWGFLASVLLLMFLIGLGLLIVMFTEFPVPSDPPLTQPVPSTPTVESE